MLYFFTDPYKNELLYSTIGRYHFYSGNKDFKDTLEECFGKRSTIPTFEFGFNLEYLSKELGNKYSAKELINKNTVFPYYAPFISKNIRKSIVDEMIKGDNRTIYTKIGFVAGSICRKDNIYYCPRCAKEDIDAVGEAYIRREHQLQGVNICPHHEEVLYEYPVSKRNASKLEYIRLNRDLINLKSNRSEVKYKDILYKISKDAFFLLNWNDTSFNKDEILKCYKRLLYERGLATASGGIKQGKLYKEFIDYYGNEFLRSIECDIEYENEYNWLKVMTRKTRRNTHPLRHILLIEFLCGDICILYITFLPKCS